MKKILIISLLVLISSCSVFRKVNRDKTDRKATEQIIKSVVRKGDTVTYVVPKMIMKDTTIYTYNRVGTRIETRFEQMLDQGFLDEMKKLYQRPDITADMTSMRCVGYRQAWDYLDGKLSYDEMRERGIIATRQLAKRQLTWLRSWPNLYQLETNDAKVLAKALKIVENAEY